MIADPDAENARAADATRDLDSRWNFDDPASSETAFRALLESWGRAGAGRDQLDLVRTQLARAIGLQRRFDEAHAILDEISSGADEPWLGLRPPELAARYLLERGRVLNSSGRGGESTPLFERAWTIARDAGLDALAIDALHMRAIVAPTPEQALHWNHLALELAESSPNERARRWRGSLRNNLGWTLHGMGDYSEALKHFHAARAAREEANDPKQIGIARWCVARCLRSLGRLDEALAMQRDLLAEHARRSSSDGFVHEEIAECLLGLGRGEDARPHFARACEILSGDPRIAADQPQRLERLRSLSADFDKSAAFGSPPPLEGRGSAGG